jgi:invasion protein IalB
MEKSRWPSVLRSWAGVFIVLAAGGMTTLSRAEDNKGEHKVHGAWTVRCLQRKDAPPCDMVQVVSKKETKQPVMVFSIGYAGKEDRYGARIGVPLGVLVSGGVAIRIDDKDVIDELKFVRCMPTGCQIEGQFEPASLEALRRGQEGGLAMLNGAGKLVVLPISLNGFSAAMDEMVAADKAWAQ